MEATGRWTGITVITPIPCWWAAWLRWNFRRLERARRRGRRSRTMRDLARLSFIAFAHWSLVETRDDRGRRRRHLLFESNFNGAAKEYVEAFARIIPGGMRGLWAGAHGVPAPLPVTPFERHILAHRTPVDHYFAAYPDGSTKMALSALRLQEAHEGLVAAAPRLDPDAFETAYRRFLRDAQRLI